MKATAQMGGLTREDIEFYRAEMKWQMRPVHTFNQIDALCDLALQAIDPQPVHHECEQCGLLVACWSDAQIEAVKRDAAMLRGKIKPPPPERP